MNEIRLSTRLINASLADKQTKLLRLLGYAKLQGHRSEIKGLLSDLKIEPKTGKRLIKKAIEQGMAGTDGEFLFPRSWKKLGINKRGGLYLTDGFEFKNLKKFDAILFAHALKKQIRKGNQHANKRSVEQDGFPTGFYLKSLGLKLTRFKTLKSLAQKYKFISVKNPPPQVIGKAKDHTTLKKNLPGLPIFKSGKYCTVPSVSQIKVLI